MEYASGVGWGGGGLKGLTTNNKYEQGRNLSTYSQHVISFNPLSIDFIKSTALYTGAKDNSCTAITRSMHIFCVFGL